MLADSRSSLRYFSYRATSSASPSCCSPTGSRRDRQAGGGYGSDAEFLEAISGAEEQIIISCADVQRLREEVSAARDAVMDDMDAATRDLTEARRALAAAYALPVNDPCDGCHGIKQAAIASTQAAVDQAEAAITDARRKIGILGDAAEILDALAARLTHALESLHRVPHDLGEVYELIYEFIRAGENCPGTAAGSEGNRRTRKGGLMPYEGRSVTGQGAPSSPRHSPRPAPPGEPYYGDDHRKRRHGDQDVPQRVQASGGDRACRRLS